MSLPAPLRVTNEDIYRLAKKGLIAMPEEKPNAHPGIQGRQPLPISDTERLERRRKATREAMRRSRAKRKVSP